jgi:hypothetical protein
MPSKESRERKEEIQNIFSEVIQIAYSKATPILREALDKYQVKFSELLNRKKKEVEGA